MSLPTNTRAMTLAIKAAIACRYPTEQGEYALMWEVASPAGHGNRYLDAVAMGTWPSRGHMLHGIEIKATRSDWTRELRNHEKQAQGLFPWMHFWWIAAAPGIVKPEELPPNWGLMELQPAKAMDGSIPYLKEVVKAVRLKPAALTPGVVASLLRRGAPNATVLLLEAAEEKGFERGKAAALANEPHRTRMLESNLASLKTEVARMDAQLTQARAAIGIVGPEPWGQDTIGAVNQLADLLADNYRLKSAIATLEGAGQAARILAAFLEGERARPPAKPTRPSLDL